MKTNTYEQEKLIPRAPMIDKTAISPYDYYCDGYGTPGNYGNGYVSVLKVSAGTVEKTDDVLLDNIVSYDRAEVNDAYVGQINMLTASSFCGLQGQVWGHDLAVHEDISQGKITPVLKKEQYDGSMLEVYDAKPLLDAGVELFGIESDRRFHLIPGSHCICANKGVTSYRPKADRPLKEGESYGVWSFIALSISRNRDTCADLFIEDAGIWTKNDSPQDLENFLKEHRDAVAWSVVECGKDSHVLFDRTYVGYAFTIMKPGEIGNAITVAPYVTLARKAVPKNGFGALNSMTLPQWLKEKELRRLRG